MSVLQWKCLYRGGIQVETPDTNSKYAKVDNLLQVEGCEIDKIAVCFFSSQDGASILSTWESTGASYTVAKTEELMLGPPFTVSGSLRSGSSFGHTLYDTPLLSFPSSQ